MKIFKLTESTPIQWRLWNWFVVESL